MISTQRLMIIIICVNVIIGLTTTMWLNLLPNRVQPILYANNMGEEIATYETSEINKPLNSELQTGISQWGATVEKSMLLTKVFWYGFVPFIPTYYYATTQLEEAIVVILGLIQSLLYVIVALELYLIMVNKKTS